MAQRKENNSEKRTTRLSLAITPTAYSAISSLAQIHKTTVNDLVNDVFEQLAKKNAVTIERFNNAIAQARADAIANSDLKVDLDQKGGDLDAQN